MKDLYIIISTISLSTSMFNEITFREILLPSSGNVIDFAEHI